MPGLDAYGNLYDALTRMPDPRHARGRRHHIADVLFIALVAVIAGAEDAQAIEDFGHEHEAWFSERCGLRHGIPAQDTYLRVLATLEPRAFGTVFERWVAAVWGAEAGRHVAIDGKTLRRSFDRAAGVGPVHSVAAFASEQGVVLGQLAVEEKENEIVAIPRLLRLVDVRGATVTIDAMGCQTAIAKAVIDEGGDYLLQVKANHPTLCSHIAGFFKDAERTERAVDDPAPELHEATETDAGHGRVETRRCVLSRDLTWLDRAHEWERLSGIVKVERHRHDKNTGHESHDVAFYILSHPSVTAARVNELVRDHWAIENRLHWVLDVTFGEDESRVRKANAAENFGLIRRAALNLLQAAPNPPKARGKAKVSIRRRRRFTLMSDEYRDIVLRLAPQTETS